MAQSLLAVLIQRQHRKSTWLWAIGLTLFVAAGGAAAAISGGFGGLPLLAAVAALFLFMLPYAALALTSFDRDLRAWLRQDRRSLLMVCLFFWAVYLIYAAGTEAFDRWALARLLLFVGVPAVLVYLARHEKGVTWWDGLAVIAIWIPFDFGWLSNIWSWPKGEGAYILNTALAVDMAVIYFVAFRGLGGVNFRFTLTWRELRLAAAAFAGFVVLALPFGFLTGFIGWHPHLDEPAKVFATPLGIFFFIALPEELLFRGLVQNFFTKRLARPWMALALTSLIFGASHLNNGPTPDWRYFIMATVAGGFYGITYARTRSLVAPALVHTAVDTIWFLLFLA